VVVSSGSQPDSSGGLKVFNTPSFSDFFYVTVEKLFNVKTNTITAGKSCGFCRTVEEVKRTLVFFICVKVLNLYFPKLLFRGFV